MTPRHASSGPSIGWLAGAACFVAVLAPGPAPLLGQEQRDLGDVAAGASSVRVVGFGDFGYDEDNGGQAATAAVMRAFDQLSPYSLGITVGDNFYPSGVENPQDEKFRTRWRDHYSNLGIRFYVTLGNHDYKGNEDAQVAYTTHPANVNSMWQMPFRFYTFAAGPVRFFALDTDEGTLPWCCFSRKHWSNAQRDWLDRELERFRDVRWKVVYGHHPIESDGDHHGDWSLRRLQEDLLPTLLKHKVTLYVAGHDHNLEYRALKDPTGHVLHQAIAGGGGKDLRGRKVETKDVRFFEAFGFMELTATREELAFRLINASNCKPATVNDCEAFAVVVR